MNKSTVIFTCLLILSVSSSFGISRHELGFFTGTTSYFGDINQSKLFYAPSPSAGLLYRRNFNPREALRVNFNYAQFRGADRDFSNTYQKVRNITFDAKLIDVGTAYEFNFLPFKFKARKTTVSTFLYGGLGFEIPLKATSGFHMVVPFGTGVKYCYSEKITVGVEWSFRKTFTDNIDKIENPGSSSIKSSIYNNDWYSFTGFFITFRLFDHSDECAAFH